MNGTLNAAREIRAEILYRAVNAKRRYWRSCPLCSGRAEHRHHIEEWLDAIEPYAPRMAAQLWVYNLCSDKFSRSQQLYVERQWRKRGTMAWNLRIE